MKSLSVRSNLARRRNNRSAVSQSRRLHMPVGPPLESGRMWMFASLFSRCLCFYRRRNREKDANAVRRHLVRRCAVAKRRSASRPSPFVRVFIAPLGSMASCLNSGHAAGASSNNWEEAINAALRKSLSGIVSNVVPATSTVDTRIRHTRSSNDYFQPSHRAIPPSVDPRSKCGWTQRDWPQTISDRSL